MNGDDSSSSVITGTVIPVASDPIEGTKVTSATTRVRHGINKGQGNTSGQWPHGGAMDGVIWSSPIWCSRAKFIERRVRGGRVAHHESDGEVAGVWVGSKMTGDVQT